MREVERLPDATEDGAPRRARQRAAMAFALVLSAAAPAASGADRRDAPFPELAPSLPESAPVAPSLPEAAPPAGELRLFWFDPKGLLPFVFEPTSREVSRIFRDVGVPIRWEKGSSETNLGEGALDIPVILLPHDPMPERARRRVLGLVPREPLGARAVWVFLSSVRWTLGHDPRSPRVSPRQANELGIALARVVAHEVVHAVAPDAPHTSGGLMHDSMDRTFLLGMRAPIDPDCGRAFVRNLEEILAPRRPATARLGIAPAPAVH
jgi:hypothetical protein